MTSVLQSRRGISLEEEKAKGGPGRGTRTLSESLDLSGFYPDTGEPDDSFHDDGSQHGTSGERRQFNGFLFAAGKEFFDGFFENLHERDDHNLTAHCQCEGFTGALEDLRSRRPGCQWARVGGGRPVRSHISKRRMERGDP